MDLKKKRVGHPSVMNFEGQSESGAKDICDLFVDFIERTYVWIPSDPGPDFVTEQLPFGSLQFIITIVESVLLDLHDSKGPSPMVCLHIFSKAAHVLLQNLSR
jgi:hypothetical protein